MFTPLFWKSLIIQPVGRIEPGAELRAVHRCSSSTSPSSNSVLSSAAIRDARKTVEVIAVVLEIARSEADSDCRSGRRHKRPSSSDPAAPECSVAAGAVAELGVVGLKCDGRAVIGVVRPIDGDRRHNAGLYGSPSRRPPIESTVRFRIFVAPHAESEWIGKSVLAIARAKN